MGQEDQQEGRSSVRGETPIYSSGQIMATSHDLTPNGGLVREIPLFQGNPGSPWPEFFPEVGLELADNREGCFAMAHDFLNLGNPIGWQHQWDKG